ncbi:lytic transglycosylase domain-containing protein [Pseudaestuariivita rosea]|uniref:lytic transglycosylase domain-containing protein n=1 Tax=Pseudaestuariivita rosea TaxID=2763263 RepID=UPI0030132477
MSWFWKEISPDMTSAGGHRLELAVNHLRNAPAGSGVSTPRLSTLQNIADDHGIEILKQTVGTNVSPALVLAVISVESSGQTDAVSSAGAAGLMQLMPATAARFGVTDRMQPDQNIKGGVAYLSWLLERFNSDPVLALAGYNAGENAVLSNNGVPPYNETRAYVPKVLAAWTVARGLCQTPPELVTDPCVLRIRSGDT